MRIKISVFLAGVVVGAVAVAVYLNSIRNSPNTSPPLAIKPTADNQQQLERSLIAVVSDEKKRVEHPLEVEKAAELLGELRCKDAIPVLFDLLPYSLQEGETKGGVVVIKAKTHKRTAMRALYKFGPAVFDDLIEFVRHGHTRNDDVSLMQTAALLKSIDAERGKSTLEKLIETEKDAAVLQRLNKVRKHLDTVATMEEFDNYYAAKGPR